MVDNLHAIVGTILYKFHNPPSISVILDRECGGCYRVAFFSREQKHRSTNYCWADGCIVHEDKVTAIVEIEQSGIVSPAKIGGKLLPIALSCCLRCSSEGPNSIPLANELTFIQVVNTALLKPSTRKLHQFENLQEDIRKLLPLGSISKYFLIAGPSHSFVPDSENSDSINAAISQSLKSNRVK